MKTKKEFYPSEVVGFYLTICWLVYWFTTLYVKSRTSSYGIGDLGAYISGIFAPVAWLWFYLSYRLQREELKLQRQTLETQVEELKHSVQAQQGSEVALKEQSEALKAQLEITAKQFEHTLEQYNKNRPKFILNNLRLTDLMNVKNKRTDIFSCDLPILNIGSSAKVTLVKIRFYDKVSETIDYQDSINVNFHSERIIITSAINLQKIRSEMMTTDGIDVDRVEQAYFVYSKKAYLKVLTNFELQIFYYSDYTGVGSERYSLNIQDGFIQLVPVDNSITLN